MRMNKVRGLLAAAAGLPATAQSASAAIALDNGSFELGSARWTQSWTVVGYHSTNSLPYVAAHSGTWKAALAEHVAGSTDKIFKTFTFPAKRPGSIEYWVPRPTPGQSRIQLQGAVRGRHHRSRRHVQRGLRHEQGPEQPVRVEGGSPSTAMRRRRPSPSPRRRTRATAIRSSSAT